MGCPCQSGGGTNNQGVQQQKFVPSVSSADCLITKPQLTAWLAILQCLKTNERYDSAYISRVVVNQMLGIVQSSINYPDNYCYYIDQLEYFRTNLLPVIISNVPECIK